MPTRASLCILMIAVSTAAFTQGTIVTTHRVAIVLDSDCAKAPDEITVVVGNNDRDVFTAQRSKDDRCRWDGTRPRNPPFRIDSRISVRLTGARSDCRVPEKRAGDDANPEPIALLNFHHKPGSARQLRITAEDRLFVSYERKLPADTGVKGSLACHEMAEFDQPETIRDVAFPNEMLLVRFGDAPWIAFDSPLQNVLKKKKELVIGPPLIGDRWFYQRKDKSRIKVLEMEVVSEKLERQGMPDAKVEVH